MLPSSSMRCGVRSGPVRLAWAFPIRMGLIAAHPWHTPATGGYTTSFTSMCKLQRLQLVGRLTALQRPPRHRLRQLPPL
jgi:hypothetical protein